MCLPLRVLKSKEAYSAAGPGGMGGQELVALPVGFLAWPTSGSISSDTRRRFDIPQHIYPQDVEHTPNWCDGHHDVAGRERGVWTAVACERIKEAEKAYHLANTPGGSAACTALRGSLGVLHAEFWERVCTWYDEQNWNECILDAVIHFA